MYCIKCGVKLGDGERKCPLCQTRVYHPDLELPVGESLYPADRIPQETARTQVVPIVLTVLYGLVMLVVFQWDWLLNSRVTWSGYVLGALAVGYVAMVLPGWFRRPNPVVFVPCGFGAVIAYLLYIDLYTGGGWFLSFALPTAGGIGLVVTTFVTLLRYVRGGRLYTVGGGIMALGILALPVEMLLNLTFRQEMFVSWSLFPVTVLGTLGGFLILLAICRPLRESMERRFFF